MPSYYVPNKNRCRTCFSQSTQNNQNVQHVSSSQQNQFKTSNTIYSFYNNLTIGDIEEKGQGNIMKQGSGGNSYINYMSKKKGALNQYCNCGNPL